MGADACWQPGDPAGAGVLRGDPTGADASSQQCDPEGADARRSLTEGQATAEQCAAVIAGTARSEEEAIPSSAEGISNIQRLDTGETAEGQASSVQAAKEALPEEQATAEQRTAVIAGAARSEEEAIPSSAEGTSVTANRVQAHGATPSSQSQSRNFEAEAEARW